MENIWRLVTACQWRYVEMTGSHEVLWEVTPGVATAASAPSLQSSAGLKSVFEGSGAAGPTDEIFQQVAVDLPESGRLGHLGEVIHAELKAEIFQVLNGKHEEQSGQINVPCDLEIHVVTVCAKLAVLRKKIQEEFWLYSRNSDFFLLVFWKLFKKKKEKIWIFRKKSEF